MNNVKLFGNTGSAHVAGREPKKKHGRGRRALIAVLIVLALRLFRHPVHRQVADDIHTDSHGHHEPPVAGHGLPAPERHR